ncbi:hypothetical protein GCM10027020_37290 [Nocardioides salsibiostraticola]
MKRSTTHLIQRITLPLAAAAVAGAVLPLGAGGAAAAAPVSPPAAGAAEEPAFSGYAAESWGAPVQMEIFEPTIPIPNEPQAEIEFGYTKVTADTGSSRGRASYLWPGAPVGEGFKTFIEGVGLPSALGESGYPAQVNSNHPAGPDFEANEPLPGSVMRTGAGAEKTYAETSFSADNEAQDSSENDAGSGDEAGGGGAPGLPEIPGLPSMFAGGLGATSPTSSSTPSRSANAAGPGIPPELAALVDFGGYTSVSKSTYNPTLAFSTSRASVSDVTLLGGVITIDAMRVKATTKSDGKKADAFGTVEFGTLSVAGQKFTMGDNGFEASGQQLPIPGLPDDAVEALTQLGVTVKTPKPEYTKDGAAATAVVEGLVFDIDTKQLKSQLSALPLGQIVDGIPGEAAELKSFLQTAVNFSPRFVVTLGAAHSSIETVQPIDLPAVETPETPEEEDGEKEAGAAGSAGSAGGTAGGGTSGSPLASDVPTDLSAAPAGDLVDTTPLAATPGLPKLFSIPGALLFGGLAGAALLGSYFRRLGVLALGGGSSCSHGLDTGLPDLRKA